MATINGTAGSDTLNGTVGDDDINGFDGADSIFGNDGNDTVFAGNGDDLIQGQRGNDTLFGESGADSFELSSSAGADAIFGGSGGTDNDRIRFVSASDVSVTFSDAEDGTYTQNAGATTGTFDDIEAIETSSGNDTIDASASSADQTIISGAGEDVVTGGAGNDSILGGLGRDSIDAGAGDDRVSDENATVAGFVTSPDTIFLGAGNDTFIGTGGGGPDQDTIYGGAGNDTITTRQSFDTVFGGDGDDVISTTDETATFGDQLHGDAGNDTITGANTNDTLFGGDGNDVLVGNANGDTLFGGDGSDTLTGGAGADTVTGGLGDDVIVFARTGGDDTVTDFDIGDDDADGLYNDQLDVSALRDLDGNPVNVNDVTVTDDGGFARLTFPEGESILLQGVPVASMSSNAQLLSAGIPCFCAGTLIATPQGDRPITDLKVGQLVTTRDNGPQPILWIGVRRLAAADLLAAPRLRPIRFAPGVFGNDVPVFVSPQHGMLIKCGGHEKLVRAIHLSRMKGGTVRQARGVRSVTYIHLLFATHQIIYGDGIPSESFYPGPCATKALASAQLDALCTVFPSATAQHPNFNYGATARSVVPWCELPPHLNDIFATA